MASGRSGESEVKPFRVHRVGTDTSSTLPVPDIHRVPWEWLGLRTPSGTRGFNREYSEFVGVVMLILIWIIYLKPGNFSKRSQDSFDNATENRFYLDSYGRSDFSESLRIAYLELFFKKGL